MRNKRAFTLAEVLITLTVIGVVAALSIPTLISSSNSTADVTKLKKVYSTLSNAVKLYEAENGSFTNLSAQINAAGDVEALEGLSPYLNIIKDCKSSKGCWYESSVRHLFGDDYAADVEAFWDNNYAKAILADGTMMKFDLKSSACTGVEGTFNKICGEIKVDINGSKGPNQIGRDIFIFWLTRSGIYPNGMDGDTRDCVNLDGTLTYGWGCAAKVLAEGEIDY